MEHSPNNTISLKQLQLPEADQYVLAFSGGSDSTALLHALCQNPLTKSKLSALHINHQVHVDSAQWAKHCQQVCHQLSIPCTIKTIKTNKTDENSLRIARLQAYALHLDGFKQTPLLITGHHLNDDIETILFRFMRGTGLNGLIGMTATGKIHGYSLYRPLIQTLKSEIDQYLQAKQLTWIVDPSNIDDNYDRNFIRNQIVPLLSRYRSDAIEQIQQTRNNLAASLDLLQHHISNSNPLIIDKTMNTEHLASTFYHWLVYKQLNPAHRRQLLEFANSCLSADTDKQPTLTTDNYVLINNNSDVFALRTDLLFIEIPKPVIISLSQLPFHWQHEFGHIQITGSQSINLTLTIAFNQQGETIKLPGRQHHSRVKELLRAAKIPTWERSRLPYIYKENQLLAVGPIISEQWQAWLTKHQIQYSWHSSNYLL